MSVDIQKASKTGGAAAFCALLTFIFLIVCVAAPATSVSWLADSGGSLNLYQLCLGGCRPLADFSGTFGLIGKVSLAMGAVATVASFVSMVALGFAAYALFNTAKRAAALEGAALTSARSQFTTGAGSALVAALFSVATFASFAALYKQASSGNVDPKYGSGFALCIVAFIFALFAAGAAFATLSSLPQPPKIPAQAYLVANASVGGAEYYPPAPAVGVSVTVGAAGAAPGGAPPAPSGKPGAGSIVKLVEEKKVPTQGAYSHSFCDCCGGDDNICCCTYCGYHYMMGKGAGDLDNANFDWFVFCASLFCPGLGGWFYRSRLIRRYNIDQSSCTAFCATCCCPLCAGVQDIREADLRGEWDPRYGTMNADGTITPNNYKYKLDSCMDDPEVCLCTICCTPCTLGKAGGDVEGGPFDFILCCLTFIVPGLAMFILRMRVRQRYYLAEKFTDTLWNLFLCTWCAVCQDVREIKAHGGMKQQIALDPQATFQGYAPAQQQMNPAGAAVQAQPQYVQAQPQYQPYPQQAPPQGYYAQQPAPQGYAQAPPQGYYVQQAPPQGYVQQAPPQGYMQQPPQQQYPQ
eukprot:Opistho-1_new@89746